MKDELLYIISFNLSLPFPHMILLSRPITSSILRLLRNQNKTKKQTQPTAHLYAHTAAYSNLVVCLHIQTRSPDAMLDRVPSANLKILEATSLFWK